MPLKSEIRSLLTYPKRDPVVQHDITKQQQEKAPSRKAFGFALDRWIQEASEHEPWHIWENLAASTESKVQEVEQNERKTEINKRSVQAEDDSLHE